MPNILLKLRNTALERLRHFEILNTASAFDFREGWQNVLPGLRDDRLFLDTYEEAMIIERLDHYGIIQGLKDAGINRIKLHMNTADQDFQHLQIYSEDPPLDESLAEITLHKGNFATRAPFASELHGQVIPMLFIQWIQLQNPLIAEFPPGRPRMPGQKHPGLGVGNKVMVMLAMLGEKLGTEGLANTPEYPHNAVLYSPRFMYLDPEAEGKLKALKRDLSGFSLADASWGIVLGCVTEERSGQPFEWFKEEQILPLGCTLKEYFTSRSYRAAVSIAAGSYRFRLDIDRLNSLPREIPGNFQEPDSISLVDSKKQ
jgi:hypothetical protein